ncbi:MAG TPA: trypsin-like peptidase domain-containing protein [Oscillatoriaceae cyanobacterium M33_DOE_052]|uniref:PDZ domain-containing protein n=1 Tax=Planktothricoides sp. SpSt-374 TaxID=2282167 RepID=A0A7C3VRS6_9CYAN|nr:trypsin-like peptidase domain-containing protein [Oscillatoriaceae cyanobacterium M33_DOE_052]
MIAMIYQMPIYLWLLAFGVGAGFLGSQYQNAHPGMGEMGRRGETGGVLPQSRSPEVQKSGNATNFIAAAVAQAIPAVVRIDRPAVFPLSSVAPQLPGGLFSPVSEAEELPEGSGEPGSGSGFLIGADGRILTNAHVVGMASVVQVQLDDGRVFPGTVVGRDALTDLAAVKIDATGLPTVRLGNSAHLVPGQWAIAIGNPLGLDRTVTAGIISATGRSSGEVGGEDLRVRFIQTDAAINPGNSGGPLLNQFGEAIGVNTAIRPEASGLGFAIPMETAMRIAHQLFERGWAEHPFLGIEMVNLTPETLPEIKAQVREDWTPPAQWGVLILAVLRDSPAHQAGLRPGDLIASIDGFTVNTAAEVQEIIDATAIGALLKVEILRQGKRQSIGVRPGPFPDALAD